jgi:KaiC/GvpD/RAD55 family RecA-like ATPase
MISERGRSHHPLEEDLVSTQTDLIVNAPSMFDLILKFLKTPGQVLLVQGPPGSGKTTFALSILNSLEETHKIYASSRVAPARLRQHFPWIDEVIDTMSGRTARASWIDELHDLRRVEPDTIFNQVLRLKHAKQRALLVVDSWEGAIRNTNDEGRRMLESAILSELDESKVSVVIVVEDSKHASDLGYLVDGIVTLDQAELDGRRMRTIAMNKLRGFSVPTKRGIFSLDKARFSILPNGLRQPAANSSPRRLQPIPNPSGAFSLGSKDMDRMLGGSVPRGSFLLVDVDSSVSPVEIRMLLNMMRANFINQNGPCVIVPTAAYSSDTVAESLSKYVGWEAIEQRVRILEYNQSLAPKKWRLVMASSLLDDVKTFAQSWDELAKISPHRMLDINVDKAVQVYGRDELSVPGLTELGANMRDTEGLNIAIASTDSKLRDQWLSVVDYHLKIKNADGSLVIYGVKPFTPLYGVDLSFDKGYPVLNLVEIV